MARLLALLQGKKTYLVAILAALSSLAGLWFGMLSVSQTADLLVLAGGLVGIGAKLERHHEEIVAALTAVQSRSATQVKQVVQGAISRDMVESSVNGAAR